MVDCAVEGACKMLGIADFELSRKLDVSMGCLRAWRRNGTPRYGRLGLAALAAGVDPDHLFVDPVEQPGGLAARAAALDG